MTSKLTVAIAALFISLPAFAQDAATSEATPPQAVEKPTPEAIRSFWTYYFKGQGNGPALADVKLCLEVAREGDNKFDCAREMPAEGIKAGSSVILWQAYLLPSGENVDDLSLQVKFGDTVRETKDIKLKGESIRTRNWTTVRLPKAGTWTLRLMRGDQELRSFTVNAT